MNAEPPDPFSSVTGLAKETQFGPDYRWDNHRRGRDDEAVVQQTLSGAAFFTCGADTRRVATGQAMLFTHDERSAYGYPANASEPYRLRFVSFRLGALPIPSIL